jgi:hypothetical protein
MFPHEQSMALELPLLFSIINKNNNWSW